MSNMQRVNKANKLHSQLQKTTNVEDRIKLHQAAIKMIEGRENEDPDDEDMSNRARKNNEFGGIQSIPLLSTNSRGPTLSSFDPSTTEGITSSTSNESLHRQRRVRRHSVSSESSTSSTGRSRKSASRNASLSQIPAVSREGLTPDAEKRVFNYNYRGPIPTKHHCQRSLFGKTVDVTPEPVETPKRRSQTKNRPGKERLLPKESLQDEIEAEIAAIDTVLANVSPSRTKIPKLIPRSINLTPSTDYRNLKDTSVEKNFEEVHAAIKSKSKDKFDSSAFHSVLKDKPAGDVTSSSISKSQDRSPVKAPNEGTVDANVTPMSTVEDIQYSNLFPRYNFDTPKASKSNDKNEKEMTPNTKFRTSLSRDTLIKSFKEALDINITAKKRFLKYERQYYEKIKDLKKLERIDIELAKFPNIVKKAMEDVKTVTVDYTEKAWRKVLAETEKLQNDAREYVKLTNENEEKRRRKSQNFGLLGNIDANEFERKHFENLSRRHENAVRISEAVKKVNIERAIFELQDRRAIKDFVRFSLDNKTIAGLSQSTSVTESTITRRSVTLTSTEIRKLTEDAMNNKRKLGKVVSKPELPHIEQESENVISERKSLSSASVILSSRHHARIIETQITDMLFVYDNNFIPSGIPSDASSVVPRLDFSACEDSASNKATTFEPVANVEQNNILEDIVIPDVDTEIISKEQQSKEPSNDKTQRSDGRTSRDVSSISESAPSPLSPYAAVCPRSPRSDHSRRHSLSKSPPLPKPSSSKGFADNFENFLLEDVSLSTIAAPIFDISGGSERGSLGFKDEKNPLEWSPGLSREFSQLKIAKSVEKIEKEEEPISAPITDDTSISTEIGEPPLDRSVEGTVKEIEKLCHEIWPQIETSMESGDFDSIIAPIINSEDPEQHYHDAYRRFIAASLLSEAQSTLKKGIKYNSFEKFKNRMIDALLNKLSIERKNDLLDGRHIWVRKNNAFMKLVQARQEAQDYDSELVNDYKRNLICKAIAAEDIINYSNERANRFTDIGYDECVELLQKHAPEQLNDLLAQYEN